MTVKNKQLLKEYSVFIGLLLLLLGILYGTSHLNKMFRKQPLAEAVLSLCQSSDALRNKNITITGLAEHLPLSLSSDSILTAVVDGKNAWFCFFPLTGKYGVYPGVFLYEYPRGCVFCGITGISSDIFAADYGITESYIEMQRKKIETMMNTHLR